MTGKDAYEPNEKPASAVDSALFVMHQWFLAKGDGEPNLRWWDRNRAQLTRLFDELESLGWTVVRDREARRIAAQTAISDGLTCPCVFRDRRWFYCSAHFHGQHDPSEVTDRVTASAVVLGFDNPAETPGPPTPP